MKKIIKFIQSNCQPCRNVSPLVIKYAMDNGYELEEINCEDDQITASKYNIMGVPVVLFLIDSIEEKRYTGESDILKNLR